MTEPENRPFFVVFEGLDGAGKSTVARLVAKDLAAEFLTTPSLAMREYRDEIISSYGASQEACQLFYLSTVFAASDQARALLARGRSVVLDRYFLSTQAYADFRGSGLQLDHLGDRLLPADLTVFLEAPLEVRRARLHQRGESAADRETLSPDADGQLREAHSRRAGLKVIGHYMSIDTGAFQADQVARMVLDELMESRVRRLQCGTLSRLLQ